MGLLSLVPTAAAGLVDWESIPDAPRRAPARRTPPSTAPLSSSTWGRGGSDVGIATCAVWG